MLSRSHELPDQFSWAPLTEILTSSTGSKIRAVQNTGKVIQEGA
jgi:hypothetical protein